MSSIPVRSHKWKWSVCGVLLMATMLNYMDRQTLSLTNTEIGRELGLNNEQYGWLETSFGLAFATGSVLFGLLVDRVGVRWLYPFVFLGWSLAGIATGFAPELGKIFSSSGSSMSPGYLGLLLCRTVLGFFEAGHWPCALVTTQRILSREDRTFGNSLLQSGASVGAVFTPLVVQLMVSDVPGSWRAPYVVIGSVGMLWVVPWLLLIRKSDLLHPVANSPQTDSLSSSAMSAKGATLAQAEGTGVRPDASMSFQTIWPKLLALTITVIAINLTWQYSRAWLPRFLREFHGYDRTTVNWFTSAYYITTDIGCLSVGAVVKWMTARRIEVHWARMATFFGCALLTTLALVVVALPKGPVLFTVLLAIGFGSLGLFPTYYAFTQELSTRRQGLITGMLGGINWVATAIMHWMVGKEIDKTNSYATGFRIAGIGPIIAWILLVLLWRNSSNLKRERSESQ